MAIDYRKCAATQHFNTGTSKCPLDPDKIVGLIIVEQGVKLPDTLTAAALKTACHADRPNRIMPIKGIVEYAVSGGEAQTSATGYGPNKVTGYSPRTDTFTLEGTDLALKANLVRAKSAKLGMYPYDRSNVIYGVNDGTGKLAPIDLAGIYPGGQDWDSSGTEANLTVNALLKDVEKILKDADIIQADFDLDAALVPLTYVELKQTGTSGSYKLVEHYGNLDVTPYYGDLLKTSGAILGASSVTYDEANEVIKATGATGIAKPSVLLEKGIEGIEGYE